MVSKIYVLRTRSSSFLQETRFVSLSISPFLPSPSPPSFSLSLFFPSSQCEVNSSSESNNAWIVNNAAADFRCRVRLPCASLLVYGVGDNATSGPSPHFRLPFESSRWRPIGMVYLSGQPNSLRWTSCSFGRDKYAFLFIFLLFLSVTRVCSLSLSRERIEFQKSERKNSSYFSFLSFLYLSFSSTIYPRCPVKSVVTITIFEHGRTRETHVRLVTLSQ